MTRMQRIVILAAGLLIAIRCFVPVTECARADDASVLTVRLVPWVLTASTPPWNDACASWPWWYMSDGWTAHDRGDYAVIRSLLLPRVVVSLTLLQVLAIAALGGTIVLVTRKDGGGK